MVEDELIQGFRPEGGLLFRSAAVEQIIGYRFKDKKLLEAAFTPRSVAPDGTAPRGESNYERLEFEGDAILSAAVAQYLARAYPSANEGELTRKRSELTSNKALSEVVETLTLSSFIQAPVSVFGEAEKLRADVLEALIAAIARDGGEQEARLFISRVILRQGETEESKRNTIRFSRSITSALSRFREQSSRPTKFNERK